MDTKQEKKLRSCVELEVYIKQFDYIFNKLDDYAVYEIPIRLEILDILQDLFDLTFTIKLFFSEEELEKLDPKYTNLFMELSYLHEQSIEIAKENLKHQLDKGELLKKMHNMLRVERWK